MSVSLCIAARGHPALLRQAVSLAWLTLRDPDTRIVIAVDDDDPDNIEVVRALERHCVPKVIVSVGPREDTLGAKYNRAQQAHRADLYVVGCDDTGMATVGWDTALDAAWRRRPDGIALVYFGGLPNVFQAGQGASDRLVELMGEFIPSLFPTWWHDRWLDEIGRMAGCIEHADGIRIRPLGPVGRTRGLREVTWWAGIFDITRQQRRETAERILAARELDPEHRAELIAATPYHCLGFYAACQHFRDQARTGEWEAGMGYDAPADERYLRAKAAAGKIAVEIANKVRAA
jgi:hypothetical protein